MPRQRWRNATDMQLQRIGTAEKYYNRMKAYAKSNYAYEGGAIPASTMLTLGRRNGILTDMFFLMEQLILGIILSKSRTQTMQE